MDTFMKQECEITVMKNPPHPELIIVNVSQLNPVCDGCSISLLQKLEELESNLAANR